MAPSPTRWSLAAVVAVLVTASVVPIWVPVRQGVAWGLVLATVLALLARRAGLTPAELGLARTTWARGLRYGLTVAVLVVPAYAALLAVGPLRRSLATAGDQPVSEVLLTALVVIPLATVLPEELAFRGVLWALVRRGSGGRTATVVSAALFGLWHVRPALGGGAANAAVAEAAGSDTAGIVLRVAGTVVFTALAGVAFGALRHRSSSLLPPFLLHWAVNGIGVVAVLLA